MAIKVIVELQTRSGRRAELKSLLETMVATHRPSQRGFLGSTRYEVHDNLDMLVEIADWESAEARVAHMQESAATGAYAPLLEMLAANSRSFDRRAEAEIAQSGHWHTLHTGSSMGPNESPRMTPPTGLDAHGRCRPTRACWSPTPPWH